MTFTKDGTHYMIRLDLNEDIIESLRRFAMSHSIEGATFSGIGAVSKVEIGYYSLEDKKYHATTYPGTYELISLNGNISVMNGEPVVHAHGAVSSETNATLGGHITRAVCAITVEISLYAHGNRFTRSPDHVTGLNLLSLEKSL